MTRPVLSPSLIARQTPGVRAVLAKTAHARQGKAAKRSGDQGEAWAHLELRLALMTGALAWWMPVGPLTKRVRRAGRLELIVCGPGPCDVIGQTADGKALVCEVKHGAKIWRSEAERGSRRDPAVAPHQAEQLTACATGHGLAFVAVDLGGERRWLMWDEIPWRADGSLRAVDVQHAPRTLAQMIAPRAQGEMT